MTLPTAAVPRVFIGLHICPTAGDWVDARDLNAMTTLGEATARRRPDSGGEYGVMDHEGFHQIDLRALSLEETAQLATFLHLLSPELRLAFSGWLNYRGLTPQETPSSLTPAFQRALIGVFEEGEYAQQLAADVNLPDWMLCHIDWKACEEELSMDELLSIETLPGRVAFFRRREG